MAAPSMSPRSSPRLPSPPPMAEDQLDPKSPTMTLSEDQRALGGGNGSTGASRRIRPGTKAEDMAEGPPLVEIGDIDSAFQLTEHLKALYFHCISDNTHTASTGPLNRQTCLLLATPPANIDRSLWLYELCRFLTQKANLILISLFSDNPPCSAATCPEMRASEWQYLCAVHDPPKSCCAVDYCCHTLDWAANVLTSPRHFPSRLSLSLGSGGGGQGGSAGVTGGDRESSNDGKGAGAGDKGSAEGAAGSGGQKIGAGGGIGGGGAPDQNQVRQLTNIMRRVYRIFAHAWFQHRECFWRVEQRTGLYLFFKTVCDVYQLIPEDNYTVSREAEGSDDGAGAEAMPVEAKAGGRERAPSEILKRDGGGGGRGGAGTNDTEVTGGDKGDERMEEGNPLTALPTPAGKSVTATGSLTKRHRQTVSLSATGFTTVVEENENDNQEADGERELQRRASVIQLYAPEGPSVQGSVGDDEPSEDQKRDERIKGAETAEKEKRSEELEGKLSELHSSSGGEEYSSLVEEPGDPEGALEESKADDGDATVVEAGGIDSVPAQREQETDTRSDPLERNEVEAYARAQTTDSVEFTEGGGTANAEEAKTSTSVAD